MGRRLRRSERDDPARNGTAWRVVPSPSVPGSQLTGVVTLSPRDVWADGDRLNEHLVVRTLVEHWDGVRWRVVPSPNVGRG